MTRIYDKMLREKLRALRKSAGLTQEQLAERLDTDPHYISAIENGKRGVGKVMLARYCEEFGLDREDMQKMLPMDRTVMNYPPLIQLFVERLNELPESEQAVIYADLLRHLEQRKTK